MKQNKVLPVYNGGRVFFANYWPGPIKVMNSFGKRNFMQPMGRPKHAPRIPCLF